MNSFWKRHSLFRKMSAMLLITLHFLTIGPTRQALAVELSSFSYKIIQSILSGGGRK